MTKINIRIFSVLFLMLSAPAFSESDQAMKKKIINLEKLAQLAEQTRQQASKLGYEWNTIKPLMDKAHAAMKEGHQELAFTLFEEARQHSELAIKQAKYADENWHILVPKSN